MKTERKLHCLLLTLLSLSGLAHAQGTAIGYQGRLNEGGLPASGLYDFTFAVFDAEAGGVALTLPAVKNAVPVTNGLFNAPLDFGPDIFTGPARWLEITVRSSGVGNRSILAPRTLLLPTPYSIFASKAGAVASGTVTADQLNTGAIAPAPGQILSYDGGNLLWRNPGDVFSRNGTAAYYNEGNVGIGTDTPAHRLSLAGGPRWTANSWLGALELPNGAALGWQENSAGQRFGMGHSDTGFYLFRTASDPGTTGSPSIFDVVVNDVGNVGIGTVTPSSRLQVNGDWDGEQGALQLSGYRPTLRFTGDADSGNESWLLHLGGGGPGNLGFFRRTGPSAWDPVMALTTSSSQMEIYGQDALGLIGPQPHLTLFDTLSGKAASRIQASGGDLFLEPASYIAGQFDTGLVIKNGSGNVGIGTLAPVAKLQAETSEVKPAVYGNATGAGTGVYGRSATGLAVYADGNAGQARGMGGFVKAMAHINPYLPADQYVVRCYNSQQTGNAASTAPCGITVTRLNVGYYLIDFGFKVDDRFLSVTPIGYTAFAIERSVGNQVRIAFLSDDEDSRRAIDSQFQIFVY